MGPRQLIYSGGCFHVPSLSSWSNSHGKLAASHPTKETDLFRMLLKVVSPEHSQYFGQACSSLEKSLIPEYWSLFNLTQSSAPQGKPWPQANIRTNSNTVECQYHSCLSLLSVGANKRLAQNLKGKFRNQSIILHFKNFCHVHGYLEDCTYAQSSWYTLKELGRVGPSYSLTAGPGLPSASRKWKTRLICEMPEM